MKTKVIILYDDPVDNMYHKGESGYIDGYVQTGVVINAIVIVGSNLVAVPINFLMVIN
jgi:hypothetical protein